MEYLVPSKFDTVVTAAVKAAGCNSEGISDEILHPSTAMKFGHDLVRMAETKESLGIKRGDPIMRSQAADFLILLSKEWPSKVAITSQRIAEERKYGKKIVLPPVEDLKTLSLFLQKELVALTDDLNSISSDTYRRAVKLIQVRLATYNKRRPGELEAMSLDSYNRRHTSNDVLQEDILEDLTSLEKRLHNSHELVVVRGKRGAGVPVLIPPDVQKPLEYISDEHVRQQINIKEENQEYIFANSGRGVFRVCDSLRELREECNLKCDLQSPDLLSCTLLRKYMATATQIIKHLGHSMMVHDSYYRVMSSTLERAKIAKLLVLADQGSLGKYKGRSLDELDFDEIQLQNETTPQIGSTGNWTMNQITDDIVNDLDATIDADFETMEEETSIKDSANSDLEEDDVSEDEETACKSKRLPLSPMYGKLKNQSPDTSKKPLKDKIPWTSEQSAEIEQFFADDIKSLKAPRQAACLSYIEVSKHKVNRKRTWEDVKSKVYSVVQREKRRRRQ